MRPGDRLGLQAGVGGEGEQKPLVGDEIVEHRVQEGRVRRGGAKVVGAEAGQVEEPAEPLGIIGDEGQCRLPPAIVRPRGSPIASFSGNRA